MTTTTKQTIGSAVSLAFNGTDLSTLANGTYVQNTTAYPFNTNSNMEAVLECKFTPNGAPSGNKKVDVFIRESLDGTQYRSGPTSGTTTTDESNLKLIGSVPLLSTSTAQCAILPIAAVLGYVPYSAFIVVKNDCGVALSAGSIKVYEVAITNG